MLDVNYIWIKFEKKVMFRFWFGAMVMVKWRIKENGCLIRSMISSHHTLICGWTDKRRQTKICRRYVRNPEKCFFFLSNEIVSVSNEKYNLFASMYAFNGIFRHIIVICISVYYHNLYSINHSLYNSMNYNICFFFYIQNEQLIIISVQGNR